MEGWIRVKGAWVLGGLHGQEGWMGGGRSRGALFGLVSGKREIQLDRLKLKVVFNRSLI